MRVPLVAGNWKMNVTSTEGAAILESFVNLVDAKAHVDIAICPPFVAIPKVRELVRRTHIAVGAQDVFWAENGAFTGQTSAAMLKDQGVTYCIIGHSETRGRFGKLEIDESLTGFFNETDQTVNLKLKQLLLHGITPILCVGETLSEREASRSDEVIREQLKRALVDIEPAELIGLVVAYEPVWAIGTGKTCETGEAERVCAMIRHALSEMLEEEISDRIRILYGGSVKSTNAAQLFRMPNIDGGLVGGASLVAEEFCRIVMAV